VVVEIRVEDNEVRQVYNAGVYLEFLRKSFLSFIKFLYILINQVVFLSIVKNILLDPSSHTNRSLSRSCCSGARKRITMDLTNTEKVVCRKEFNSAVIKGRLLSERENGRKRN
jgi:hypothetical protein